jgi:hypothetical protein
MFESLHCSEENQKSVKIEKKRSLLFKRTKTRFLSVISILDGRG